MFYIYYVKKRFDFLYEMSKFVSVQQGQIVDKSEAND